MLMTNKSVNCLSDITKKKSRKCSEDEYKI